MLTDNCWIDPHSHSSKQVRHQLDFGGAGDHQPTTRGDCQHRRLLITENGLGVANRRGRRRGSKAGLAPAPKRKPIAGDKQEDVAHLLAAQSKSLHVCLSPAGFLFGTGAGPALLPRRRPRRFATPKPFSVIRRRRCWQSPRVVG